MLSLKLLIFLLFQNYKMRRNNKTVVIKTMISPSDLHDINAVLNQCIQQYAEGVCTDDLGIIANASDAVTVTLGTIMKTSGMIHCHVEFIANYFNPEIGTIYPAKIIAEYEQGLFTRLVNRINVFIPKCTDSKESSNSQHYEYIGETRGVRILQKRFKNNSIDCIGEFVVY